MKAKRFISLLLASTAPLFTGMAASFFTQSSIHTWYPTLNKPFFNPPNGVFAPVWIILYIIMGISGYAIWKLKSQTNHQAKQYFVIQLILNFCWSFFFFYMQSPATALVNIILLWLSIIIWIRVSYGLRPWIGLIQIPYFLWVTFAMALNAAIFHLN
ncbi:benzodiazepine receptor TspO [Arcticibacter svalbardensis MN12-7]|uniref:Benzodiazepine receptor TspO n=1 Tax=Arcticibacter svalbardensis MN12-7 TaxID=1150600 RepID=R9GWI8_9SPHI|nr:TspO/MBR family protein [Arcticibacter svalbardensis]EOR93309.1 benzodiazepine receptor TspO [Arcticibacter svalbardensis MN12-7]